MRVGDISIRSSEYPNAALEDLQVSFHATYVASKRGQNLDAFFHLTLTQHKPDIPPFFLQHRLKLSPKRSSIDPT